MMEYKSTETQITLNIIGRIFNDILELIVNHASANESKRLTIDFLEDYNKLRDKYIKEWDI